MSERSDRHKASGDYVCVVVQDPAARKALAKLTAFHGSKRAAIEAALIKASTKGAK